MTNFICNECYEEIFIEQSETHLQNKRISTAYNLITRILCGCGCKRIVITPLIRWPDSCKTRTTVSLKFDNRIVHPIVDVI